MSTFISEFNKKIRKEKRRSRRGLALSIFKKNTENRNSVFLKKDGIYLNHWAESWEYSFIQERTSIRNRFRKEILQRPYDSSKFRVNYSIIPSDKILTTEEKVNIIKSLTE